MKTSLKKENRNSIARNQSGQGLTEYFVLVVLIAGVSIGATKLLGKAVKDKIQDVKEKINQDVVLD